MNRISIPKLMLILSVCFVGVALAAERNKLNRLTRGIQVTGGTTTTSGVTLITSTSSTNEFSFYTATTSISGPATSQTLTFPTAYLITPTVYSNKPGVAGGSETWVVATPTTTSVVLTGLNSTTLQNVNIIVYGTTRSGVFE